MMINHNKIRATIKTIGIMIFIGSIVYRLREVIIYGGKRTFNKDNTDATTDENSFDEDE